MSWTRRQLLARLQRAAAAVDVSVDVDTDVARDRRRRTVEALAHVAAPHNPLQHQLPIEELVAMAMHAAGPPPGDWAAAEAMFDEAVSMSDEAAMEAAVVARPDELRDELLRVLGKAMLALSWTAGDELLSVLARLLPHLGLPLRSRTLGQHVSAAARFSLPLLRYVLYCQYCRGIWRGRIPLHLAAGGGGGGGGIGQIGDVEDDEEEEAAAVDGDEADLDDEDDNANAEEAQDGGDPRRGVRRAAELWQVLDAAGVQAPHPNPARTDALPAALVARDILDLCPDCRSPYGKCEIAMIFEAREIIRDLLQQSWFAMRRASVQRPAPVTATTILSDLTCGERYQQLIQNHRNFVSLMFSLDGIAASATGGKSYHVLSAVVVELGPTERWRAARLLPLGVYLGERGVDFRLVMMQFQRFLTGHLLKPIQYRDPLHHHQEQEAEIVCFGGVFDMLARAEFFNTHFPTGFSCCWNCTAKGEHPPSTPAAAADVAPGAGAAGDAVVDEAAPPAAAPRRKKASVVYYPGVEDTARPRSHADAERESAAWLPYAMEARRVADEQQRLREEHQVASAAAAAAADAAAAAAAADGRAPPRRRRLPLAPRLPPLPPAPDSFFRFSPLWNLMPYESVAPCLFHYTDNMCEMLLHEYANNAKCRKDRVSSRASFCDEVDRRLLHMRAAAAHQDHQPAPLYGGRRRPRAEERRQFLVAFGAVVLDGLIRRRYLRHFCQLVVVLRRLFVKTPLLARDVPHLQTALRSWIIDGSPGGALALEYLPSFWSYNTHSTLHIADSLLYIGCPVSSAPWESAYGQLVVKYNYGVAARIRSFHRRLELQLSIARLNERLGYHANEASYNRQALAVALPAATHIASAGLPPHVAEWISSRFGFGGVADQRNTLHVRHHWQRPLDGTVFNSVFYLPGGRLPRVDATTFLWRDLSPEARARGAGDWDRFTWLENLTNELVGQLLAVLFLHPNHTQPVALVAARCIVTMPGNAEYGVAGYRMAQRHYFWGTLPHDVLVLVQPSVAHPLNAVWASDRHPSLYASEMAAGDYNGNAWIFGVGRSWLRGTGE